MDPQKQTDQNPSTPVASPPERTDSIYPNPDAKPQIPTIDVIDRQPKELKKKSKKPIVFLILAIVVVAGIAGYYFIYMRR